MKASGGRIQPHDYEQKDYWTYKIRGGLLPGWLKRACKGKRDFWREWDFDAEELGSRDSYALGKNERESGMSAGPETVMTGDKTWEMPEMVYGNKTAVSVGEMGMVSSSRR